MMTSLIFFGLSPLQSSIKAVELKRIGCAGEWHAPSPPIRIILALHFGALGRYFVPQDNMAAMTLRK
jgi:hypothetical protein